LPSSVLPAGSPRSRTSLWVAIGVVAVLVAATVILLVAKPFSGKADQGSTAPSTVSGGQSSGTGTSGSTGSESPTAKSSPSANSTAPAAGTVPGVGPGNALTPAELALLGPAASTLTNCGDNTEAFNATSPGFKEKRVLRCEVPSSSDGSDPNALVGRTLLYVLTAPDAAAAGKVLAKIKSERKQDSYSGTDPSGQSSTGAGTVQVVVADHESAFGTGQDGKGNAVMAWTIGNQPYVGVMVSLGFDTADELYKYFQINYKPR
ncbi:MAG: hypothetical protein M3Y77_03015, partial [Actinomycetota bacterium]|nr:hypothetical protein [Actinomycetota bacterium]